MATMFPTIYPKVPNEKDPEFVTFQILKKLPDNYLVFYSKKFKGTGSFKEECEVDFIIFDQNKTLICLEVKGGVISYDGIEDKWMQNGKDLITSPDRQASAAMHNVLNFLKGDISNLNIGWALGFPDCCLPEDLTIPSGLTRQIIIDQIGYNNIEKSINMVSKYYVEKFQRRGIGLQTAKLIQNRLTSSLGFVTKLGVRLARDYSQLIEVTESQFKVLNDILINNKTIVRGYAGTGKTLIATELARRLEKNNKKVLFLFYNRLITKEVSRSFDRKGLVTCTRFFKFAKRQIEKKDPKWWNLNYQKNTKFWEEDLPLKLITLSGQKEKYDAIIIDEGQDFKSDWFDYLNTLLADKVESHFVIFYDEYQDIFNRWSDLPWGGESYTKKQLTENCRNTKNIVGYLNDLTPSQMVSFENSPFGEKVIIRNENDDEKLLNIFIQDLTSLLKKGVDPGKIVILTAESLENTILRDLKRIGNFKLISISRYYNKHSKDIQFTTINMFKGLEADIVFVICSNENFGEDLIYTQCSRARLLLFVYNNNQNPK